MDIMSALLSPVHKTIERGGLLSLYSEQAGTRHNSFDLLVFGPFPIGRVDILGKSSLFPDHVKAIVLATSGLGFSCTFVFLLTGASYSCNTFRESCHMVAPHGFGGYSTTGSRPLFPLGASTLVYFGKGHNPWAISRRSIRVRQRCWGRGLRGAGTTILS